MRSQTGMAENMSTNKSLRDELSEEEIVSNINIEEVSHRNKIVEVKKL
jgi:hypothetical protein